MSFQLVQACIDMRGGLLTPAQKASLLVICRFADDKGMNSFPKLETIAERTEFNRRTILEAVKGLIENGWITAVRTQYGRNFSVSVNKIMANKADTADVQEPARVHEVTHVKEPAHVQETTSRCAGSCTANVQEPAHRREQLKEQEKTNLQTVDDSPFSLETDQPQAANELPAENTTSNTEATAVCTVKHPAETKKPAKRKAITHLFELDAIPDEWRELCEQIRPDLDPQRVFVEFRFYWTQGKGMGTRRSDKGWTSTWMNWIKRQKEQRVAQTNGKAPLPPHKDPAFHFGKEYYDKSVNPDGTTNWGV